MSAKEMVLSRSSSGGVGGGGSGGGSRWCPTPEQVMLLEGMYRGGLKTPTATQIQQITARLSLYGKIQGKNVFYWFQNHKARDRQKLRKKLMTIYQHQRLYPPYNSSLYHDPLPLQGGILEDSSSSKHRMNKWKVDPPMDDVRCNFKCDCPLMTVMMIESTTTPYCCTRVPPKTLQLFPITTTLKDDDDHLQCSTSKPY